MKSLDKFSIDLAKCKNELTEFKKLLDAKSSLSERDDILPFFKSHKHLAALIGAYNPKINGFDRLGYEVNLFGDYSCDLAVGDSASHSFVGDLWGAELESRVRCNELPLRRGDRGSCPDFASGTC